MAGDFANSDDVSPAKRAMAARRGTSVLWPAVARALSPTRVSALYVLALMAVVFSVWSPEVFPQVDTARQILNSNAITILAALALVVPLSAGVFDISVPYTMNLAGVCATYAIVEQGRSVGTAIVIAMAAALAVGLLNGLVVVRGKIDSLIGTLATGFLVQAVVQWRSGSRNITGTALTDGSFVSIAQSQGPWGLTLPVFYAAGAMAVIWFLMERTAAGRRAYAVGFNADAARLAGVRVERIRFASLIVSALFGGIAGIVLASNIGSGSSSAGNAFLLPAFAAVFLGATQFRPGRMNALGTGLAVLLLGTGVTGLGYADVEPWVQSVFTGVVLIIALWLTGVQQRRAGRGRRAPDAKAGTKAGTKAAAAAT